MQTITQYTNQHVTRTLLDDDFREWPFGNTPATHHFCKKTYTNIVLLPCYYHYY